jgi:hypothetical protein
MLPAVQQNAAGSRYAWYDTPVVFAFLAVSCYLLLLVPMLIGHRFNLSVFIVAGDRFVDAFHTNPPILVRPHSDGYDGQFYYALATDPAHAGDAARGVVIDHPAWRAQRIFYPLVVYAVALGRASFVPAAMVAVNVASLFALAFSVRRRIPRLPALAIMLWPGLLTALTHDTTEILACALLFAAVAAYLDGRFAVFGVLAAMAALTRETSSLLLCGIALAGIADYLRGRRGVLDWRAARPVLAAGGALVPFLLWHTTLALAWGGTTAQFPLQANIGWPLAGFATRLYLTVASLFGIHGTSVRVRLMDFYVLAVMALIAASAILMAISAFHAWRRGGRPAALALGWGCMLVLMSLLSASRPWAEPTSAFRVFSETWLVGWLLVSLDHSRRLSWSVPALLPINAVNFVLCIVQLGGGIMAPH